MSANSGKTPENRKTESKGFFAEIGGFFKKIPGAAGKKTGSSRPKKKNSANGKKNRFKGIRYDRLLVLAGALTVLVILIILLVNAFIGGSKKNKDKPDNSKSGDSISSSSVTSEIEPSSSQEAVAYTVSDMPYSKVKEGYLILINNDYAYTFPETQPSTLVTVLENKNSSYIVSNGNILLDSTVVKQVNTMMEGFSAATGLSSLEMKQGYRSKEYQQDLYDRNASVAPGYSEHHSGYAMNFSACIAGDYLKYDYNDERLSEYKWLYEHCAEFGFVPRYTADKETITGTEVETDHFRYVGIPHAWYMTKNNLCLEEYLEALKSYSFENPLTFTCDADGKNYVIYYTEATVAVGVSDVTQVYVPANAEYTMSGDNIGGFIVTVVR